MPAADEKELFPIEYWRLTCGGAEADGLFMTAMLPGLDLNSSEMRHVGQKSSPAVTKVNVTHSWSDLTLTRGVDKKGALWKWIEQGLPQKGGGGSKVEKKEMVVTLCNSQDAPIQTWTFTGAWPKRYSGPQLDANGGSHAVESITFDFDEAHVKFG